MLQLKGYRTYILMALAVATAIVNYVVGDVGLPDTILAVLFASGLATGRSAVAELARKI